MAGMLDKLKEHWQTRPRVVALVGASLAIVIALLLTMGGDPVAPVIDPGTNAPMAGNSPQATGQAQPNATTPAASASGDVEQDSAVGVGAVSDSGGGESVSPEEQRVVESTEQQLNAGVAVSGDAAHAPASAPGGRSSLEGGTTPGDVAAVGARLDAAATAYNACVAKSRDGLTCLSVVPDGITVERAYESAPYGFVISGRTESKQSVRLMLRGTDRCRMLGTSSACDGWQAAS